MAWLSVIGRILYYISLPLTTVFNWVLIALAPVFHLFHYLGYTFLLPFRLLAKFEVKHS